MDVERKEKVTLLGYVGSKELDKEAEKKERETKREIRKTERWRRERTGMNE